MPHMNTTDNIGDESTANRECVHSRLIDAPRERVFRAFSEPNHLARWWGRTGSPALSRCSSFGPAEPGAS
ncbi:MAG: SRPBCC domain-containing protein [Methylophilaceae bacterium]